MTMLRTDVLALLDSQESSGLDFKRDDLEAHDLARHLVGFANLDGGTVLLGVEDNGTVCGLVRDDVSEWVTNAARDLVRPPLVPYVEVVRDVTDGRDVCVVRVTPGFAVHAVYRHNTHRYYLRVGYRTREASPEEVQMLAQQRGRLRGELQPVSGSTIDDLDPRRLQEYFAEVRQQPVPDNDDRLAWTRLLVNTGFLTRTRDDDTPTTVAGMLLFGRRVPRFLPHSGIDAVAYPTAEKDYATVERRDLRGALVSLGSHGTGAADSGLVEQGLAFVARNTRPEATIDAAGLRRERDAYPHEAVREALVNALVHRDYLLSGTTVELSVYPDRLEILSPGRLPNGITPDAMRDGIRAARNQLLKDVMRDYGYLEHSGPGVPRKIIRGMREHNGTEPELVERGEQFLVRLWQ